MHREWEIACTFAALVLLLAAVVIILALQSM